MVKEYAKKEIYNELERQFDKDLGLLLTDRKHCLIKNKEPLLGFFFIYVR